LDVSFVSTTHALIRWNGSTWGLRDLGSTNGTYVNGRQIPVGETIELSRGMDVAFGDTGETWRLVDDTAPVPTAVPVAGGPATALANGFIGLPSPDQPLATLHMHGEEWLLETEDGRVPIVPGSTFSALGMEWRLECPSGYVGTVDAYNHSIGLDEATLIFRVSSDEEHVSMAVSDGRRTRQLGERACYYLGLVLARQRSQDVAEGLTEPGWVDTEALLRMIPDYAGYAHLNVDIFRLREALAEAGVRDASRIIETRRGQRRLGTEHFKLERGV
jgi:hypothetical protein